MSLDDTLKQWAKSAQGKAKIQAAQQAAQKSGKSFGSGGNPPSFYAEELIRILKEEIANQGFDYGQYLYWTDMGYDSTVGRYEIHVNFMHEMMDRESLYPEGYPEGVDNIAALMNTGYRAKDYVYGTMPDGRRGRSLKERPGAMFMQLAVSRFNSLYGKNAIAEYSDDYIYFKRL